MQVFLQPTNTDESSFVLPFNEQDILSTLLPEKAYVLFEIVKFTIATIKDGSSLRV